MITAVFIAIYAGLGIFVAGCLLRIFEYARTPLHLRWELYPLPHEHPYRAAYGGSYFETQEWWRQPQVVNRRGEWLVMVEEIFLLKSLRRFNRRLWAPSFLFHFGLYLMIIVIILAGLSGLTGLLPASKGITGLERQLVSAVGFVGIASAVMIVLGSGMLMIRRLTDPGMRSSSKPGDIFNLGFFILAILPLIIGYLLRAADAASLSEFARAVICFDRAVKINAWFGAGVVLASILTAYIPFTHMAHFIAKYFTWHAVRWDDRRYEDGSAAQMKMAANLSFKPTWAAPHVGADGKRKWAEIAGSAPTEIKK